MLTSPPISPEASTTASGSATPGNGRAKSQEVLPRHTAKISESHFTIPGGSHSSDTTTKPTSPGKSLHHPGRQPQQQHHHQPNQPTQHQGDFTLTSTLKQEITDAEAAVDRRPIWTLKTHTAWGGTARFPASQPPLPAREKGGPASMRRRPGKQPLVSGRGWIGPLAGWQRSMWSILPLGNTQPGHHY